MPDISTMLSVSPYFDDYSDDKGFVRILFKPGLAVQARELTQLQTIIQKQIERFGTHIFQDGSKVVGCDLTLDLNVKCVRLEELYSATTVDMTVFSGSIVVGETSGARAQVVTYQDPTSSDQPLLIISLLNSINFVDGEDITVEGASSPSATTISLSGASGLATAQRDAAIVSSSSGVLFVSGFFVFVAAQTLILETESNVPSYRIGYSVVEELVNSDDDFSLLDNAAGSYNFAAPGADRLKIDLVLDKKPLEISTTVENVSEQGFVEFLSILNGIKLEEVRYPVYTELENTLARRTYDESGDYTVRPFGIQLVNHKGISGKTYISDSPTRLVGNSTTFTEDFEVGDFVSLEGDRLTLSEVTSVVNNTVLILDSELDTDNISTVGQRIYNESKFSVGMEPGKAYVRGYEYESLSTKFVDIDKGREYTSIDNYTFTPAYGNSLVVKNLRGVFDINSHDVVQLHCVPSASIDPSSTANLASTSIGTARVRMIEFESSITANTINSDKHRTYLYDIRTTSQLTGTVSELLAGELDRLVLDYDTTSNSAGAYVGTSITVTTDDVQDTRTILDYEVNLEDYFLLETSTAFSSELLSFEDGDLAFVESSGLRHVVVLNESLRTAPTVSSTYSIRFSAKDLESIALVDTDVGGNITIPASADVDLISKYNSDPAANTQISDTGINSLLFPLPKVPVKTTKPLLTQTLSYKFRRLHESIQTDDSGTTGQITLTDSLFYPTTGTLSSRDASRNFLVIVRDANSATTTSDNIALANGDILSLSDTSKRQVIIGGGGETGRTTVRITCNTSAPILVDVVATQQYLDTDATDLPPPKQKTLVSGDLSSTTGSTNLSLGQFSFSSPNKVVNGKDVLSVADCFNIVKVVDSLSPDIGVTLEMLSNTAHDVTSKYSLDTGQRDNFYDHSALILKPGNTPPVGRILAIVDYFVHGTEGPYLCVDSYPKFEIYDGGSKTFDYSSIPSFTSPTTGRTYDIRNCIDFRPIRAQAPNVLTDTTSIRKPVAGIRSPHPTETATLDFQYYLSRIDKVVLTRDRRFSVVKGTSAEVPVTPPDSNDAMTLYTLKIPAYTFAVADVLTKYIDNRRYTMRDIGELERRIENLEYYTSLSLLEKEAEAVPVTSVGAIDSLFNPNGDRFKNGILVDPFAGHSVGDVENEDYFISIDYDKKELRAPFKTECYKFDFDRNTSNNVNLSGDLVTLNYEENVLLDQPLYSRTLEVNPFNIVNFVGELSLNPSSDIWYDDTSSPVVIVNLEGQYDNWEYGENKFGTQWNDWETSWTGKDVQGETSTSVRTIGELGTLRREAKLTGQAKTRIGVGSRTQPDSILRNIGSKVVDLSITRYVREQDITFSAKGMRPSSNLSVYVDDLNLSSAITPAKTVIVSGVDGKFNEGQYVKDSANNVGLIKLTSNTVSNTATLYIAHISGNSATSFSNGLSIGANTFQELANVSLSPNGVINTASTFALGSALSTDEFGQAAGTIRIPRGTIRTGERLIRLTDNSENEVQNTSTVSETTFFVRGYTDTITSGISSTREVEARREQVDDDAVVQDATRREKSSSKWTNPTTQTFFVDPAIYPSGTYILGVDLYFKQKDTKLPISLQLRPVVNGRPSASTIYPFGEVTLTPDFVNVADIPSNIDVSTMTSFNFKSPVYLTPGEHAIVLQSNSNKFILHSSVVGDSVTGTTRNIDKRTYVGSLFTLQNVGTWSESPGAQLAFRIRKAEFQTSGLTNTFASFISSGIPLSANTSNTEYSVFKLISSSLVPTGTSTREEYKTYGQSNYSQLVTNKNYFLDTNITHRYNSNGDFTVNSAMTTTNLDVSPVIDKDRFGLIVARNQINNAELLNGSLFVANTGGGYLTNATGTVVSDYGSGATVDVEVEQLIVLSSVGTANTGQVPASFSFVSGEAVGKANTSSPTQFDATANVFGVIAFANSSTLRIKSNPVGGTFQVGDKLIALDSLQSSEYGNTGISSSSNTIATVSSANGYISSVNLVDSGTGYVSRPTIQITDGQGGSGAGAYIVVNCEECPRGGNITAKYITRRVTLEDGFDAGDIKVILNAYKPIGTDVKVYYKIKSADDPASFDDRPYVLMDQETPSTTYSTNEEDFREFVFKTTNDTTSYTSNGVEYGKFKTFSIKIGLLSDNTVVTPRVKDMRAIALDA